MNEQTNDPTAFDLVSQDGRVARTARMLNEETRLQPNQRTDIAQRVLRFIADNGLSQKVVARECGISATTISEVLRNQYAGKTSDKQLVKLHNWLELAARRYNLIRNRRFAETGVAKEIIHVAGIVAETCGIGVVFGPARIGKTMTLKALVGDQRFGDPVLITLDESTVRAFALCRRVCSHLELSVRGTFDTVFTRLVKRLEGTMRMLMFDEIDLADYHALEMIRHLHDATGCPVLLAGKPKVYAKLGFRELGDFSEVTDQLSARIVVRRDLTERTRGKNPQPLFTLDDIRKLIQVSDLKIHLSADAEKWLQARASTLGTGGIGAALVCLYLACKLIHASGEETLTARHLEAVADLTMGHEDAERIAEVVTESSGMRRVV